VCQTFPTLVPGRPRGQGDKNIMKRELPNDPMLRELIDLARKTQISRRAALAGVGGTAAGST